MGYDLHITRKRHWVDEDGPVITPDEWLAVLDSDPELSRATDAGDDPHAGAWKGQTLFWFTDGEIRCSNPDRPIVQKMYEIAQRLQASLQGDDRETYDHDGIAHQDEPAPSTTPRPGLFSRLREWFRHRQAVSELQQAVPSFKVGQRVRDPWGQGATILSVDPKANHGLGRIRIRQDDGREADLAYVASGLQPIEK
jgi:hypothetical protein